MKSYLSLCLLFSSVILILDANVLHSQSNTDSTKQDTPACVPAKLPDTSKLSDFDVYTNVPYSPGEIASYNVSYLGVLAGTGYLEVEEPVNHNGKLHRSFFAFGKTGDWYKAFFTGEDFVKALVLPVSGAISQFYMEQDEHKIFGKRFRQKKWLDYDHDNCKVMTKIQREGRAEKQEVYTMMSGSTDILGAVYWLREQDFSQMKSAKKLVYSSRASWWLEATPVAKEKINVPAGAFDTMKIKLTTFIGDKLQQSGEVLAWVDLNSPHHPLVMLKGEVKIGSLWVELTDFQSGKNPKP